MGYLHRSEMVAKETSTASASTVSIMILTWSAIHTPARSPATGHATARTMIPVCVRLQKMSRNQHVCERSPLLQSLRMKLCDTVAGPHRKHPNYDEVTLYAAKQHMCVVPSLASGIWIRIESNQRKPEQKTHLTSGRQGTNLHMIP